MVTTLKKYHQKYFGRVQYSAHAPGRINLIGEHTDYNNGYVLPAAIDRGITFYFTFDPIPDAFELYSQNLDNRQTFDYNTPLLPSDNWAKYLQALIHLLAEEEKINVPFFQASLHSDIPTGGGLSSSAALTVGFLTAINHHLDLRWPKRKMAYLAQYTEHRIGAKVGIMDPFAILTGQKDHFILIDCRTNDHTLIPAHFEKYVLLLIDTGISHDLADSEYNDRRAACEKVLEKVNTFREVEYVSDISFSDLKELESRFPDLSLEEVEYVLEENQRVLETVGAIQSDQWDRVGELMYDSHSGLSNKYLVSCPELDFLVTVAHESGMVTGARMMGGGFGGSTINLLSEEHLEEFQSIVNTQYLDEYGRSPDFLPVHPDEGASVRSDGF